MWGGWEDDNQMQLRKKFRQTSDEKKETPPLSVGKVLSHHTAASGVALRANATHSYPFELLNWPLNPQHPTRCHIRSSYMQPDTGESEDAADSPGGSGFLVVFACCW